MPELYFELPPAGEAPALGEVGRSIRGATIKTVSLAALASGLLAYGGPPDPQDWQRWVNRVFRHWAWHEMNRRRRRHYPNGYTDSGHPPIH